MPGRGSVRGASAAALAGHWGAGRVASGRGSVEAAGTGRTRFARPPAWRPGLGASRVWRERAGELSGRRAWASECWRRRGACLVSFVAARVTDFQDFDPQIRESSG